MVAVSSATIHPEEASPIAPQMSVLGIDITQLVFHVVGRDDAGAVGFCRNFQIPPDLVVNL